MWEPGHQEGGSGGKHWWWHVKGPGNQEGGSGTRHWWWPVKGSGNQEGRSGRRHWWWGMGTPGNQGSAAASPRRATPAACCSHATAPDPTEQGPKVRAGSAACISQDQDETDHTLYKAPS